jgi:hypothetical protein
VLRKFRDNVLFTTPSGKILTGLYYFHAEEIVEILADNPELKEEVGDLVEKLTPRVSQVLLGKRTALTREELVQIKDILGTLPERGGPMLKVTINFILDKIENESFLQQYGVCIVENE